MIAALVISLSVVACILGTFVAWIVVGMIFTLFQFGDDLDKAAGIGYGIATIIVVVFWLWYSGLLQFTS